MKIEIGQYVRTKHYGIFKVLNIEKDGKTIFFKKTQGVDVVVANKYNKIEDEIIGEPNNNILKLVKIGDYINGSRVIKIQEIENYPDLLNVKIEKAGFRDDTHETIFEKDVESILTKEQFENQVYNLFKSEVE